MVDVIVISNSASGHTSRFPSALTGQNSCRISDVDVGQAGALDAVPFAEAVMVGKVDEVCCLWCLPKEEGRALYGWIGLGCLRMKNACAVIIGGCCAGIVLGRYGEFRTDLRTRNAISRTNMIVDL